MNVLFMRGRIIYGGGEKVVNWLTKQLIENGDNVIYAISQYNDKYKTNLEKVGLKESVKVVIYNRTNKYKNIVKYFKEIKEIYTKNNIDVLIIFGGSLIEQLIATHCGVRVVLSERCNPASRSLLSQILKKIQYRFADGYVFQTPEASKYYGKRAEKIGTIIPNPIIDKLPEPQFEHLRKEIVSVGRLSEEKNHRMLIEAFALFLKEHSDYKLVIYGSGPLKEKLLDLIRVKNIENSVNIISGKTNIIELIKGAELFVLPSNTEGMPNTLIEAMSMGLLSISTDCPIYGPRMLIKDGYNGYLTPIKDSISLYNRMSYAIDNKELAFNIRRNSVHIREILQAEKIAGKWITYINNVIIEK